MSDSVGFSIQVLPLVAGGRLLIVDGVYSLVTPSCFNECSQIPNSLLILIEEAMNRRHHMPTVSCKLVFHAERMEIQLLMRFPRFCFRPQEPFPQGPKDPKPKFDSEGAEQMGLLMAPGYGVG